jgi:fluoride exporter
MPAARPSHIDIDPPACGIDEPGIGVMALPELLIGGAMVALGAMVGTPARFFVSGAIARRFGETFPWGTLVVNVSGCVVMGTVAAFARAHGLPSAANAWLLVATGFLGSYTTVSSFALQTLALVRDAERAPAVGYIALSLVLCLAAVAGGFAAGSLALAGGGG